MAKKEPNSFNYQFDSTGTRQKYSFQKSSAILTRDKLGGVKESFAKTKDFMRQENKNSKATNRAYFYFDRRTIGLQLFTKKTSAILAEA